MNLEINRNFKTGAIMKYEGQELASHLKKRNTGIDKTLTKEEATELPKHQTILPNHPTEENLS